MRVNFNNGELIFPRQQQRQTLNNASHVPFQMQSFFSPLLQTGKVPPWFFMGVAREQRVSSQDHLLFNLTHIHFGKSFTRVSDLIHILKQHFLFLTKRRSHQKKSPLVCNWHHDTNTLVPTLQVHASFANQVTFYLNIYLIISSFKENGIVMWENILKRNMS